MANPAVVPVNAVAEAGERPPADTSLTGGHLLRRMQAVRAETLALAAPLSPEDQMLQSMPDASPTKWHLAHTTWFFETFVLATHVAGYDLFDGTFSYLFNSYYDGVGARHPRPLRGQLSRPSTATITAYRRHVDAALDRFAATDPEGWNGIAPLIELGINHEQQHQELLLTDILHAFSGNPLRPAYREAATGEEVRETQPLRMIDVDGGLAAVGHDGVGFAFDNEAPRHDVWLRPFRIASRAVTNGEWQAFMVDGGYRTPGLWLSDGWTTACQEGWEAPLYWHRTDAGWETLTLCGVRPVDDDAPVCHVSFYEADAFARWAGRRLPTEAEWEVASSRAPATGNDLGSGRLMPAAAVPTALGPAQMIGDVWEWTASAYQPYPGYRSAAGAVGEYNGKFMCNQMVLRGGSCATPRGHIRRTYRNFFYPHQRWQFTGVRLAEEAA